MKVLILNGSPRSGGNTDHACTYQKHGFLPPSFLISPWDGYINIRTEDQSSTDKDGNDSVLQKSILPVWRGTYMMQYPQT